jgi:heterodisulfide reductase subunit A-like polyferredoxin
MGGYLMIFNAGTTGGNNSEEIAVMLTQFMSEVESTLTSFKSEIDADITALSTDMTSKIAAVTTNVNSKFSTLTSTVNSKATVKSVQRGILPAGTSTTKYDVLSVSSGVNWAYYVDVTISAVTNLNKCFVSVDNLSLAIPKLVNATTLRLYINSGSGEYTSYLNSSAISWQVVEFY